MKVQLAHILQSLYRTNELNEVPVHRLQETLREHPYFGAAQYLLAQKLKQQQSSQFDEQVEKAAVYFHDPLWMYWQLNLGSETKVDIESNFSSAQEVVVAPENFHEEVVSENGDTTYEEHHSEIKQPASFVEHLEETPVTEVHIPEPAEPTSEPEIPIENTAAETFISDNNEAEITEQPGTSEWQSPEPIYENVDESNEPSSEEIREESAERPVEETVTVVQLAEATVTAETNPAPANANEPVAFDPYYTIDYFASQGIKAPVEVEPTDKLGKQLKSFTEWLKTMKRLPQTPMEEPEEPIDDATQQDVRRIADGSLENKGVLTETMAEVLVKQGKREEAIEMYEKLSLLDPSKSAYFAAKIENLKSELI